MSEKIKGLPIPTLIVPYTTDDQYPTHDEKYGRGGYRSVETLEDRDNIPDERKALGMLVYVRATGVTFRLTESGWSSSDARDTLTIELESDLPGVTKDPGKLVFVKETGQLLYYDHIQDGWINSSEVHVGNTPPIDKRKVWYDWDDAFVESPAPGYSLEEMSQEIVRVKAALDKIDSILSVGIHPGTLSQGGKRQRLIDSETLKIMPGILEGREDLPPGSIETDPGTGIVQPIDPTSEPEVPVKGNVPAVCIKMGTAAEFQNPEIRKNLVPGELVWVSDSSAGLYIINSKREATSAVKGVIGGGGTGSGSVSQDQLASLPFIGFSGGKKMKITESGMILVSDDFENPKPSTLEANPSNGKIYYQKLYINAVYCSGRTADEHSYLPCSHNFVELSNLTKSDINLSGMYLMYSIGGTSWQSLPLTGTIKAKSTYLVRGAQCSVLDVNTTRIKVKTYDQIWTDPTDLDPVTGKARPIKFDSGRAKFFLKVGEVTPENEAYVKCPFQDSGGTVTLWPGYIDLVGFEKPGASGNERIDGYERNPAQILSNQRILVKYFSMDPVRQATKSITNRNNSKDWYFVDLGKSLIPDVESYTPKASWEGKTIFFNKSKFLPVRPNVINVTLGRQATDSGSGATRCFNWISVGYYDEYLWYRQVGTTSWTGPLKSFDAAELSDVEKPFYSRVRMEATDGTPFTSHKLIIRGIPGSSEGIEYEYIIGRLEPGQTDPEKIGYRSEPRRFKVYTSSGTFDFTHVTDQQGFNWDEYQVWAKAAEYIGSEVPKTGHLHHFTLNTGDYTQNGNRMSEWIDYFDARDKGLSDLAEMCCIGNNDLCPKDIYNLGEGEDSDKISSTNMSFFFCYEIDTSIDASGKDYVPIMRGLPKYQSTTGETVDVPILSLYSFDYGNVHFLSVNTEITNITESDVYGVEKGSVYPKIKEWCERDIAKAKASGNTQWIIAYNHEMPFTILTKEYLNKVYWKGKRDNNQNRGGSHINYECPKEFEYWFSEFAQNQGISLILGGHKHTFSHSWPLKENIVYEPDGTRKVYSNNPIIQVTLDELKSNFGVPADATKENALYRWGDYNTTDDQELANFWYPNSPDWKSMSDDKRALRNYCCFELYTGEGGQKRAPVYVMNQATSAKHTSNKELPSPGIPWLHHYFPAKLAAPDDKSKPGAKVNGGQRYPFYITWRVTPDAITGKVWKIENIMTSTGAFSINALGTLAPKAIPGNGDGASSKSDPIVLERIL